MNSQPDLVDPLSMQALYYDTTEQDQIRNATVALAGLGGIGGFAFEALIRNGFGHLRIADGDAFQSANYRQVLMAQSTIGHPKVAVATRRARDIRPQARIDAFDQGVTPSTCRAFVEGADIVLQEADTLTAALMIHHWAHLFRIPVLHASRAHWTNSTRLQVQIDDYRDTQTTYSRDFAHWSDLWGVPAELLEGFMEAVESEKDEPHLEKSVLEANRSFRIERVKRLAEVGTETEINDFTRGKGRIHLRTVIHDFPDDFDKRRIAPEQAMVMAGMAVMAAKDVLMNRESRTWHFEL